MCVGGVCVGGLRVRVVGVRILHVHVFACVYIYLEKDQVGDQYVFFSFVHNDDSYDIFFLLQTMINMMLFVPVL